jgi:uncharacterized protein (TIGR04255 family)
MAERVRFERPPVIEVVCGVLFGSLAKLRTAHIGVFWDSIRGDFPEVMEAPPMLPIMEGSEGTSGIEFELTPTPPLPRTWLISTDSKSLVQIQRDRFAFNWRRKSPDDGPYPSYDRVIVDFDRRFAEFQAFLSDQKIGEAALRQFELTYSNSISVAEIPSGEGLFCDHVRNRSRPRFLPELETFDWRTSYVLPDANGRLHVQAVSGRDPQSGNPQIRLDLTARGVNQDLNMRAWFDLAHEWIVNGFADITTEAMHRQVWRRIS